MPFSQSFVEHSRIGDCSISMSLKLVSVLVCILLLSIHANPLDAASSDPQPSFWQRTKEFVGWSKPSTPPPMAEPIKAPYDERLQNYDGMAMMGILGDIYGDYEETKKELK